MNVHPIGVYKIENVAESLRQVAHEIDLGHLDAVRVVLVLESSEGVVDYKAFGKDFQRAYAAGLLHAGILQILT